MKNAAVVKINSGSARPARQTPSQRLHELQSNYYLRLEASVQDLREFFGEEAEDLVTVAWSISPMDLLMTQRALTALLEGWRIVRESRYSWRSVEMVERYAVEVAPGQFDFLLREGRQFWLGPEGQRLTIDLYVDEERESEDSEMTFCIPRTEHGWLCQLLPRLREWGDRNHFLRGQAFNAKGQFLKSGEETGWEDVILSPELRQAIQRNCIDLLAHAGLYKANGIPLKRGIVLYGPPGTGKTMIGRALARHCGVTFIYTTPGMLEEAADVRRVFDWGRRFAPSILFFEDFDLVAGHRDRGSRTEILGEFLAGLDGVDSGEGIITIATTNDLKAIEPALKDRPNRIDCVLEIPTLAAAERRCFLQGWLDRRGGTLDLALWVRRTRNYTGAQLQEFCRLAVFEAVEARIREGRTQEAGRLPLTDELFERAFAKLPRRGGKSRIGFVSDEDEA